MRPLAFALLRRGTLDRSIIGPFAKAKAALEPPRSIRLQFMLRPRGARSRIARNIRPATVAASRSQDAARDLRDSGPSLTDHGYEFSEIVLF
jgi:hypothetical protein